MSGSSSGARSRSRSPRSASTASCAPGDAAPVEFREQLAEALGEDGHLDLLERDGRHATAVAGLQEERPVPGFTDRAGDETLGWVEDVATSGHARTLYRFGRGPVAGRLAARRGGLS